jgi:hypothetical protein
MAQRPATDTGTASVDIGDVAVDIGYSTIKKLSAADGTVLWSVSVANDGALAVDPLDLGVYTGYGSHDYGHRGRVYKYAADGSLAWTNSVSVGGFCNFYYVSYAAVDTTSANPGVVWTQSGCYGGIAKTRRDTGAQQWSVFTDDIGRASIDPFDGEIYDITNAGPDYNYDTLCSASADGTTVNATTSCEGYTELNPADGMLYQGSGHAPMQPSESAIIADLPPGRYTAIGRGKNIIVGVALVEVYDLDQ